ncbi:MAG: bile acid:sodium symporter [Proteobacteria bacterium]|nr:bile acid:sodium symporter [Pseudomonadota bacterium]
MKRILSGINKNLVLAIPLMMTAGFLYGLSTDTGFLKNLILPFTFLMVYPMMVNMNVKKIFEGGDGKTQVMTQVINFGISPFIAYLIGMIFFENQPYMALGILLVGLLPTSGMTISWTGLANGNIEAAIKMLVTGLLLGSFVTPFYIQFLMGTSIDVNMLSIIRQIALIVFLPLGIGYLTRKILIGKYGETVFKKEISPLFPGLSTLGVLGIVFTAIAIKAKIIYGSPQMILYIMIPLGIIYVGNYAISTIAGRRFLPYGDAVALVYGTAMRNLSIALAIAMNAFGKEGADAALVIAVAYIIQVQSAAWYVKFSERIFGFKKTTVASLG